MSTYQTTAIVSAFLPRSRGAHSGWKPEEGPRERDLTTRKSFTQRLASVGVSSGNILHLFVFVISFAAVIHTFVKLVHPLVIGARTSKQTYCMSSCLMIPLPA